MWTRDSDVSREVLRLRGHGLATPREASSAGYNGRLDEVRATIALNQLDRFEEANSHRRTSARRLRAAAERHQCFFRPQRIPDEVSSNFQNLAFRCFPKPESSLEAVIAAFAKQGVEAKRYFAPPLHHLQAYPSPHPLPNTEAVYESLLCLPLHDAMSEATLLRLEAAMDTVATEHGVE